MTALCRRCQASLQEKPSFETPPKPGLVCWPCEEVTGEITAAVVAGHVVTAYAPGGQPIARIRPRSAVN